jgi:FAD:protein FMN transferase
VSPELKERSAQAFRAMGTEVVVAGASEAEFSAIWRLFCEWERVFSRFRPDSELNRVNASGSEVVVVSSLFARAVRTALTAAAKTDGFVDPTLGRAIEVAGYDRDFSCVGDDERPLASTVPGRWRTTQLSGRLLSRSPGTRLDLNGVVKSLAVDEALQLIERDGFVTAGGDIAVRGDTVVGLPAGGSIRLLAGGLATSGTTGRRWRRGGRLQHHLLDPRTGRPAASRWNEVTVAAASCLSADVAAKAAFLQSDDGPAWLDAGGLPGRFLENGRVVTNMTWRDAIDKVAGRPEAEACS